MKIAKMGHVSYVVVPVTETEGIVVPYMSEGPCPSHYVYMMGEEGAAVLGSLPDSWVAEHGGDPEAVAAVLDTAAECDVNDVLDALTAKSGRGSVAGWEPHVSSPWVDQGQAVTAACNLPTWLGVVTEGEFGAPGPLAAFQPIIRWGAVARRLAAHLSTDTVQVLLGGDWGLDSQVQWSAEALPLGLRIACIEAGLGFELVRVYRAPVEEPAAPLQPQVERPKQERKPPAPRPTPQPARQPAPPPQPVVADPGPPVVLTPVVINEIMFSMIPPENHNLFREEVEKEIEKAGGVKATENARKRAIDVAFNRVRSMRAAGQGLSRAERKAAARAALEVIQGGVAAPEAAPAASTAVDLLVAKELQASAELLERMERLSVRLDGIEAESAATDALFDSVMGEGASEALRAKAEAEGPKTPEQVEAESAKATELFNAVMCSVKGQVEEEQAQVELFLELDASLRATAAARVASGESRELVILDLLTAPVVEQTKAKPVRKEVGEKLTKPTRKKSAA